MYQGNGTSLWFFGPIWIIVYYPEILFGFDDDKILGTSWTQVGEKIRSSEERVT